MVLLAVLALSICVLSGCRTPSESQYQLYSVNGSNITNSVGENCTLCNFTTIPDRYMFGLSGKWKGLILQKTSQGAKDSNIRPGTCGSTNGTIRCQGTFPNTFNITDATVADITASNSSNLSPTYAKQSEQSTSTTFMNHTRVHHLSEAVCSILIASVVLNFFFLLLGFFVDTSKPRSGKARVLFNFVFLDWCAQCAAVVMVYLIIRNEIAGAHSVFLGIDNTHLPVKFELGFWLLVGAAASRPLSAVLVVFFSQSAETEPGQGQDQHWQDQGERLSAIRIPKSFRDTPIVDDEFYTSLTYKIASTIRRLRTAVETYHDQRIIDEGCKRLFTRFRDDLELASLMPSHFYQHSATLFLGMHSEESGIPPGLLLYESCPHRGLIEPPGSSSRGVYLVVLRECCHGSGRPSNTPEYKYVGSGRSDRGVMLRVKEHTSAKYRNEHRSELYRAWDSVIIAPCVAIYQLAEWDPLPMGRTPGTAEGFDEILLAEAIWQVVLQTSAQGNMSEFTQHLRGRGSGNADLINNVYRSCNVLSALEKIETGGWRNRHAD
jgi:hypothetical protein